jgi:hypothetical protein
MNQTAASILTGRNLTFANEMLAWRFPRGNH